MDKNFTFTISEADLKNFQKAMAFLEDIEQKDAISGALKKGADKIAIEGAANLSARNKVKSGNLGRSISTKRLIKKGQAKAGFKRSGKAKGNHAHLVDRGTDERYTKSNAYRGSVSKGQPNKGTMFWTDAVMKIAPRVMKELPDTVYKEITRVINKYNNKK